VIDISPCTITGLQYSVFLVGGVFQDGKEGTITFSRPTKYGVRYLTVDSSGTPRSQLKQFHLYLQEGAVRSPKEKKAWNCEDMCKPYPVLMPSRSGPSSDQPTLWSIGAQKLFLKRRMEKKDIFFNAPAQLSEALRTLEGVSANDAQREASASQIVQFHNADTTVVVCSIKLGLKNQEIDASDADDSDSDVSCSDYGSELYTEELESQFHALIVMNSKSTPF
jgi:hypothetical protein